MDIILTILQGCECRYNHIYRSVWDKSTLKELYKFRASMGEVIHYSCVLFLLFGVGYNIREFNSQPVALLSAYIQCARSHNGLI